MKIKFRKLFLIALITVAILFTVYYLGARGLAPDFLENSPLIRKVIPQENSAGVPLYWHKYVTKDFYFEYPTNWVVEEKDNEILLYNPNVTKKMFNKYSGSFFTDFPKRMYITKFSRSVSGQTYPSEEYVNYLCIKFDESAKLFKSQIVRDNKTFTKARCINSADDKVYFYSNNTFLRVNTLYEFGEVADKLLSSIVISN